jgi:ribosomal protein L37AE/L43A
MTKKEYDNWWRKDHPERCRQYRKRWKINHPEKYKKAKDIYNEQKRKNHFCIKCDEKLPYRKTKYCLNCGEKIRKLTLRFKVLMRDNFTCRYCGRKAPNVVLHTDHILPKSKGGKTIMENLTTACEDCNIGKSDTLLKTKN